MTVFSLNEVLSLPLELPSRRFCLERLELLGDAALRCETDGLMGSWGEFSTKLKSILGGWLVGGLVGWLVGGLVGWLVWPENGWTVVDCWSFPHLM